MVRVPKTVCIDFETEAICPRPRYPPVPCGVSIEWPGKKPKYYAWGHPSENNCTKEDAITALREVWGSGLRILAHNTQFDYDVAVTHMEMEELSWDRLDDTMFLLFLEDPHAKDLKLKPAAERYLGMKPEEQDAVSEWLVKNQPVEGVKITRSNFGAYISKAPGKLVGEYAKGDVIRTTKLFKLIWPSIVERGMLGAYDRERELMPILLQNSREGIRVDLPRLRKDVKLYGVALAKCDEWIRKRLKAPTLNIDADQDLADALEAAGVVTQWVMTTPTKAHPAGVRSTAKKNMTPDMFADQKVASALGYHSRLSTCLGTFMRPWLLTAEQSKGIIYTNWSQVRQPNGSRDNKGARTGRISSSPNFMNIPKDLEDKDDGYVHPSHIKDLPTLPLMRIYLLPDKGCKWVHRDYNQQELRILAHFEDAGLCAEYQTNPTMDIHTFVKDKIQELLGMELNRGTVKTLNFGTLYGQGLGSFALKLKTTVDEVKKVKAAQRAVIPGLAALEKVIKETGKAGNPIVTWGGRQYFAEPPIVTNGHTQTFEYKLLNYAIQGSAADCTKEALIRYDKAKKWGRFIITVHDEINLSVPREHLKEEMELLRQAMMSVGLMADGKKLYPDSFDVPMLSDGKIGPRWSDLKKYRD